VYNLLQALQEELISLYAILSDFRERIAQKESEVLNQSNILMSDAPGRLEMLRAQITSFVHSFATVARQRGERLDRILPLPNAQQRDQLLQFVNKSAPSLPARPTSSAAPTASSTIPSIPSAPLIASRPASRSSRPPSARISRPASGNVVAALADLASQKPTSAGRSRPSSTASRSTASITSQSPITIDESEAQTEALLDVAAPFLNAFDIDVAATALRSELEQEHQRLLADVEFVRACLDDEMQYEARIEAEPRVVEPSIKQLSEWRGKLEQSWLEHQRLESATQRVTIPAPLRSPNRPALNDFNSEQQALPAPPPQPVFKAQSEEERLAAELAMFLSDGPVVRPPVHHLEPSDSKASSPMAPVSPVNRTLSMSSANEPVLSRPGSSAGWPSTSAGLPAAPPLPLNPAARTIITASGISTAPSFAVLTRPGSANVAAAAQTGRLPARPESSAGARSKTRQRLLDAQSFSIEDE
jgi:hypothetical protein